MEAGDTLVDALGSKRVDDDMLQIERIRHKAEMLEAEKLKLETMLNQVLKQRHSPKDTLGGDSPPRKSIVPTEQTGRYLATSEKLAIVLKMYDKYQRDLVSLQKALVAWETFPKENLRCHNRMCNMETELLYLRVRAANPEHVFELGPACGWSSVAILTALDHNGRGHLHSFDAEHKAPYVLRRRFQNLLPRWTFHLGDIKRTYQPFMQGKQWSWDFLYIDALHKNTFAVWYIEAILLGYTNATNTARREDGNQRVPVQVHDIYNPFMIREGRPPSYARCVNNSQTLAGIEEEVACINNKTSRMSDNYYAENELYGPMSLSGEGSALINFLALADMPVNAFTVSPLRSKEFYTTVQARRQTLGLTTMDNVNIYNPSLFFSL